MAVIRWNPWRDAPSLRDAANYWWGDSFARPERARWGSAERPSQLPLDVYTTPEEIVVVASLPGLMADQVDITIDGDRLVIRGALQAPLENVDYVFNERAYGDFTRTLTLNVAVDAAKAEAVFENGVLTLTLPKAEETKPKMIKVKSA